MDCEFDIHIPIISMTSITLSSVIAIVLVGFVVSMSVEEVQQIQALVGACVTAEGATEADMHEMMAMELPSTAAGMCLNACLMEKTGITVDGVFSVENSVLAAKRITDNNADKMKIVLAVTADCGVKLAAIASPDRCEYAKQVGECNTAGGLEHGYLQRDLLSP